MQRKYVVDYKIMLSSTDLPLSPDSPLLSDSADIDFGCDSGIEAEMDEPHGKNASIPRSLFFSCQHLLYFHYNPQCLYLL